MSIDNSMKSFWWYFLRVLFFAIAFFATILLLSDWNYGINKTVGWAWEITNFRFWIGVLIYTAVAFGFLSIITALVMKIAKMVR